MAITAMVCPGSYEPPAGTF